jgi:hypothetical protein
VQIRINTKIQGKVIQFARLVQSYVLPEPVWANPYTLEKAEIFKDRFREVISDPLNILIERVPEAGYVDQRGNVFLHNGNRVPRTGDFAYYGGYSEILIFNRGVHEPLEEFCFQEVLKKIDSNLPTMIELGSYWAHYSMWFLKDFPHARSICVEPELPALRIGQANFALNGFVGEHINAGIGVEAGHAAFEVDSFLDNQKIESIQILHSDIQGAEMEMLKGAQISVKNHLIDYIFISTHSDLLHESVERYLKSLGYRIEVSSPFSSHTTSYDGLIMASSPKVKKVFDSFRPLGRLDILNSKPREIVDYLFTN